MCIRDRDYTALVGQHVQLVVTECSGRKIVGSINKVTAEQNKSKREEFWANVEVGKTYTEVTGENAPPFTMGGGNYRCV